MPVYVVGCDCRNVERDYRPFFERLEDWRAVQALPSLWIIDWDATAIQVRDDLAPFLDEGDGLLVAKLRGESAWRHLATGAGGALQQWIEGDAGTRG